MILELAQSLPEDIQVTKSRSEQREALETKLSML